MRLSEQLRNELKEEPVGTFAPYYFRYLGYREHLSEPIAMLRAGGSHALFTKTEPHIYKHDSIAGSTRGLFCSENEVFLNHASDFVSKIGKRNFFTNADHFSPNYRHVLTVGIPGLIEEIEDSLQVHQNDTKKCDTLRAMKLTLKGFLEMIANYSKKAKQLKNNPEYDKDRLELIAINCEALTKGAPQTFAQGLQLVWLCHTAFALEEKGHMALGRMDQYLYPFYQKDTESGILSKEQAIELLENTFTKIPTHQVVNICIGGMDAEGNCQVNDLSYCILFAVKNCNAPGPNLSARITQNTPDPFLDECLQSIGTGLGYPALMNDEVNRKALERYGYEKEDVYDYSMVGCIENFMTGMQPPWTDGRFDTPRFFDYVFNNGVSTYHNSVGLALGEAETISSMEEFMKRFEAQLSYGIAEYNAAFHAVNDAINQDYYAEPFLSCFCYDCIGRGLDINNGGSKYPSVHGVGLMGVGTVTDSLAAIEKVIFIDKEATLSQLRDALNHNFEGYEDLRQKLLKAPKYGNNDDFVDKYAIWFLDFLSTQLAKYKTRDGGGIYAAMAANISNIIAGKIISATPDGRKQGEPLSDAASPTYGKDKRGVTSTLSSVVKPDYTKTACGTVLNQKFSPSMFQGENRKKLLALVKTYFMQGGQEIQINATSRRVLKDAMEHPEQYGNLVVRVSGFSDYYVKLLKEVQEDILNRTQQNE